MLALDAVLLAWAVVWIFIGLRVAHEVNGLAELSGTVSTVGSAVEDSSRTIRGVDVPVLGQSVQELLGPDAARVLRQSENAGASARASGRHSRESIEDLSTLLGISVALIPTTPLLFLYLPLRITRARESRALRRLMDTSGGDPEVERFLARRAIQNLSYSRLRATSPEPWRDVENGHCRRLARAELARLGLHPET